MKLPNFKKMRKIRLPGLKPKPKRLQATARRAAPVALEEYDDEEPTTRFSTALVVVLILHVVAAGGIYAFSRIKATHLPEEPLSTVIKTSTQKSASVEGDLVPPPPVPVSPSTPVTPATSVTPISGNRVYHVKSGDTFIKIANAYGVMANDLAEFNGLKESSMLRIGQTLNIPQSKTAAAATTTTTSTKSTPATVAAKATPAPAKSTPAEMAKLDPKKTDKTDKTDKTTEEMAAKAGTPAAGKTYTVKKGDNPVTIAKTQNVSYEELLKLNKIDDPKKLQIGAVLKLPPPKKKSEHHE